MKIGILSDTHGTLAPQFEELCKGCDYLIHAGDIDNERCYNKLKELNVPLYMIRGNCDYGNYARFLPETLTFTIANYTFLLIHNQTHLPLKLPQCDFVICGHTHQYQYYEYQGVTWINPGSAGRSRGASPCSMAVLTITSDGYSVEKIEKETL